MTTEKLGRANGVTLRSRAYDEIRRRILRADLEPGAPLSENQLAADLDISRTPIREALLHLEREGLVRVVPQRGAFVAELSVQDIQEIYQVREQLEGFAARVAAEKMPPDDVRRLCEEHERARASAESGEFDIAFEADFHLHQAIIKVTNNRRLAQILARLDDQVHRLRYLSIRYLPSRGAGRLQDMLVEHDAIVAAIRCGNPGQADRAMRRHLQKARDSVLRLTLPLGMP